VGERSQMLPTNYVQSSTVRLGWVEDDNGVGARDIETALHDVGRQRTSAYHFVAHEPDLATDEAVEEPKVIAERLHDIELRKSFFCLLLPSTRLFSSCVSRS
jgi:hypothetical protein